MPCVPPCPPTGLNLAKQAGLQQSDLVEVIKLGAIACPMFALKVWCRRERAFDASTYCNCACGLL